MNIAHNSKKVMVFDIGGTSLRGATYCPATESVRSYIVRQTPNRTLHPALSAWEIYEKLLAAIASVGKELLKQESFSTVSIAFPGPVDQDGHIIAAPGIWGKNPNGPINMRAEIQRLWPVLPVFLCNDLTAAGFRYATCPVDSFCLVTVSTGIGCKIFIDGHPQLGARGTGGEIGHAKVCFTQDAPVCNCGESGHLQATSSGSGVLKILQQQARAEPQKFFHSLLGQKLPNPETVSNVSIAEAFRASDPFTVNIINKGVEPLAAMLVNLHLALGLERFIIIGGFAFALGESYRLCLAKHAASLCWDKQTDWQSMIQFGFEDDLSGLVGAGRLASLDAKLSGSPGKTKTT